MTADDPYIACTAGETNAKVAIRVIGMTSHYIQCMFTLSIFMDPPTEFSRPLTLERDYLRRFCSAIRVANRDASRTPSTVELPDWNGTTALRVMYQRRGFSPVVILGGRLIDYSICTIDDLPDSYLRLVAPMNVAGIAVVYDNLRCDVDAIERFVDALENRVAEADEETAE